LLLAYLGEFRDTYGPRMVQAFRAPCRQALERDGLPGLAWLWARIVLDLASGAFSKRTRQVMGWKVLMPLALVGGLLIALVHTSPGWDDTEISATMVELGCGLLGALHPARAWQWPWR
jgi:hypothetical protein